MGVAVVLFEDFQAALGTLPLALVKIRDSGMRRCARDLRVVALGEGREGVRGVASGTLHVTFSSSYKLVRAL